MLLKETRLRDTKDETDWQRPNICEKSLGFALIRLNGLKKWFGNKTKGMIEWLIVYWLKLFDSVEDNENSLQWIGDTDNMIGWWDDGDITNMLTCDSLTSSLFAHVVRGASGSMRVGSSST